jgi:hypothetical protein
MSILIKLSTVQFEYFYNFFEEKENTWMELFTINNPET